tara:strand:+ start:57 stop:527 length:471 start_codon:yes stop_codon:yes gene_type:complete
MPALAIDTPPDSAPERDVIAKDDPAETPNFSFRFRGRRFSVWVQTSANGPEVYLACEIGRLPFSAENRDGRRAALMILSAAGSILSPASSRLMLSDLHAISLLSISKIDDATDSKSIVAAAAAGVVANLPLIELMETSISPAVAAPDTKTLPAAAG